MKLALHVPILLAVAALAQERTDQYGVMVFDSVCLEISQDKNTRLELPMVNGQADKKHPSLLYPLVKIKDHCVGHYEVRKFKSK